MPFPRAKVVNVSGETKKRLLALRGSQFGQSEHDIVKALLTIGETISKTLNLGLDDATEIPPACQSSGASE